MSRMLLDTTILIDVSKGANQVVTTLNALVVTGSTLGVCAISVAEFLAGVPLSQRWQWERWLGEFAYLDITREAAMLAGSLRYDLARQGRVIHIPDALIAATAIVTDSTLLTNNVKDYPIQSLKLRRLAL